jgi:hypothetical protein
MILGMGIDRDPTGDSGPRAGPGPPPATREGGVDSRRGQKAALGHLWAICRVGSALTVKPLGADGRLEADDDRIAVWRDVLATTNGAKIKTADVDALNPCGPKR